MENENTIFFWKTNEKNGYMSNWYEASFVLGDFEYKWVEQYMMSQKAVLFGDSVINTKILRAKSPKECKRHGRDVTPFNSEVWDEKKETIVYNGVRAKFEQNPELLKKLKDTGDALLVEASPNNNIWGIGLKAKKKKKKDQKDWPGENLLGKILMEVRADVQDLLPQEEVQEELEKAITIENEKVSSKIGNNIAEKMAERFQIYKQKAADLLKDSSKMEPFLLRVDEKLKTIPKLGDKLAYIPELILLVRSYVLKEYTDIALPEIISIIAALIYFVTPLDIIPDGIPGVGLLDDALIAGIVVKWCEDDIEKYMKWLKSK